MACSKEIEIVLQVCIVEKGVEELCRNTLKCIVTEAAELCCDTGSRHSRTGPRHSTRGAGTLGTRHGTGTHVQGALGLRGAQGMTLRHNRLGGLGAAYARWLGQIGALCT